MKKRTKEAARAAAKHPRKLPAKLCKELEAVSRDPAVTELHEKLAQHKAAHGEGEVKRVPVDYDYRALNPEFMKRLAQIAGYAAKKYGSWEQYAAARLVGEKSPVNHAYEHLRSYQVGEPHDRFGADPKWHLVAAAYNLMMEFFYCERFGHLPHPLVVQRTVLAQGDMVRFEGNRGKRRKNRNGTYTISIVGSGTTVVP